MNSRFHTAFLATASAIPALVAAYTPSHAASAVQPAIELVQRVTPEYAQNVHFSLSKGNAATISGRLVIQG